MNDAKQSSAFREQNTNYLLITEIPIILLYQFYNLSQHYSNY